MSLFTDRLFPIVLKSAFSVLIAYTRYFISVLLQIRVIVLHLRFFSSLLFACYQLKAEKLDREVPTSNFNSFMSSKDSGVQ